MFTKRLVLSLIFVLSILLAACAPAAAAPADIVQRYYEAVNAQQLDTAMSYIADDAVFVNPIGVFSGKDSVRESLQIVMDEGITFELSNFRDTNSRVVYDYQVFVNGDQVETGTDGLTVVREGKITLDTTERWEWKAYVTNVAFTADDADFSGPDEITGGWVTITLTGEGQEPHHIQLVKLEAGKTLDDLKAALTADPESYPDWATPYGGPNAPDPGGRTSAVVNLPAGRYALIDLIPNAEGVPHFQNGLMKALTVTEPAGDGAGEPEADATVTLGDFSFALTGELAAGEQTIRFLNSGEQAHEAFLVRLEEGKTTEDYLNTPPGEMPPGTSLGGITGIAPDDSQYIVVNLEPGTYALYCFLPDMASHAPHFALGMMQEIVIE